MPNMAPDPWSGRDLAIFVQPTPSTGKAGPVAAWITTAVWAEAAERRFGRAPVLTPAGVLDPHETRAAASRASLSPRATNGRRSRRFPIASTLAKDALQWWSARRFKTPQDWRGTDVAFVWQRHELFHRAGVDLARKLGRPLVLFAAAPQVWEARTWGVRRPGWGWLVERIGEQPQLRAADVIVCPSAEVARQLLARGARPGRTLTVPAGVDIERFTPEADGGAVRRQHGLEDRFVIGWAGSFRPFHGLESLMEAASRLQARIPRPSLLLVGDGPERPRLEGLARELGLDSVAFTGTVSHDDMPAHIAAMDVAVVLHSPSASFHYGPIKLSEYLACARPTIAPRAGDLETIFDHEREVLLVESGVEALCDAICVLAEDPARRSAMGAAGRRWSEAFGSSDRALATLLDRLAQTSQR